MPKLNLVVVRARDPYRLAAFYGNLGLSFVRHRHGGGPEHFATEDAEGVFEIYPTDSADSPTRSVRLGFEVQNVTQTVQKLVDAGGSLVVSPRGSKWGLRAVIDDPDGHRVELVEPPGNGLP